MHTTDFIAMIESAAAELGIPEVNIDIAGDAETMPFANDLDDTDSLAAFPDMPLTSMEEGIRHALRTFRTMHLSGELTAEYRPGG